MRRILSGLQQQRGQVMVMFIGIFTVIAVVGLVVVDFGLWFSERRGAQTDADFPALAGARECMLQLATGQSYPGDAEDAIRTWFNQNNPQPTDAFCDEPNSGDVCIVPEKSRTECYDPGNGMLCVDVVVRHKSRNLFSKLSFFDHAFDDVAGNIGAHARACAGAAQTAENIMPAYPASQCFQNPGQPNFQHYCWIAGGAHDKDCGVPGNRCWLNLAPEAPQCSPGDGHKDVVEMFGDQSLGANCSINPHPSTCDEVGNSGWSDCVELTQGDSSHIEDYVYDRIHAAPCDTDGNGIDDLDEVLDPQTGDPTICSPNAPGGQQTSPRLISVPVIDPPGDGTCADGEPCPIIAFAAFYIAGCFDDRMSETELSNMLDGTTPLTTDQIKCTEGIPQGHQAVLGKWVKIIVAGSGVGPADEFTTQFSIALCDWETGGSCGGEPMPTPVPWPTPTPIGTPVPTVAPPSPTVAPPSPTVAPPSPTSTPPCPTPTPCTGSPGQCKKTPTPTPGC